MARNSFNDKTDKMLGLAYDIRNRVRRLLFHANKPLAWRGTQFQVLNRHLPDTEITSIIIDLKDAHAVLTNGCDLYKQEEATILTCQSAYLTAHFVFLH